MGSLSRWSRPEAFDIAAAGHLLGRAGYGVRSDRLEEAVREGLDRTVERVLSGEKPGEMFRETFRETDALLKTSALEADSIDSLKAWWAFRLTESPHPLEERMTLMWHDHFATSYQKVQSVRMMADQNRLFRREALGRFDRLLLDVARDPAMLVWLDSNLNRKRQPNENFSRELFELFGLGLGNYTEKDIQEAARAFSGWHVRHGRYWFNEAQCDRGSKQVLGKTGAFGGEDVIRVTLEQPACSRLIARRLLEEFVAPGPKPEQVEELAGRLKHHRWQLRPVLGELFRSELFFAERSRGARIKSPIELVVGTFRQLGGTAAYSSMVELTAQLGQDLFQPPSVKGWDGDRGWLNTASMILRLNFASEVTGGRGLGRLGEGAAREMKSAARVDGLTRSIVRRPLIASTRGKIIREVEAAAGADRQRRVAWHMVVSLPEYQLG